MQKRRNSVHKMQKKIRSFTDKIGITKEGNKEKKILRGANLARISERIFILRPESLNTLLAVLEPNSGNDAKRVGEGILNTTAAFIRQCYREHGWVFDCGFSSLARGDKWPDLELNKYFENVVPFAHERLSLPSIKTVLKACDAINRYLGFDERNIAIILSSSHDHAAIYSACATFMPQAVIKNTDLDHRRLFRAYSTPDPSSLAIQQVAAENACTMTREGHIFISSLSSTGANQFPAVEGRSNGQRSQSLSSSDLGPRTLLAREALQQYFREVADGRSIFGAIVAWTHLDGNSRGQFVAASRSQLHYLELFMQLILFRERKLLEADEREEINSKPAPLVDGQLPAVYPVKVESIELSAVPVHMSVSATDANESSGCRPYCVICDEKGLVKYSSMIHGIREYQADHGNINFKVGREVAGEFVLKMYHVPIGRSGELMFTARFHTALITCTDMAYPDTMQMTLRPEHLDDLNEATTLSEDFFIKVTVRRVPRELEVPATERATSASSNTAARGGASSPGPTRSFSSSSHVASPRSHDSALLHLSADAMTPSSSSMASSISPLSSRQSDGQERLRSYVSTLRDIFPYLRAEDVDQRAQLAIIDGRSIESVIEELVLAQNSGHAPSVEMTSSARQSSSSSSGTMTSSAVYSGASPSSASTPNSSAVGMPSSFQGQDPRHVSDEDLARHLQDMYFREATDLGELIHTNFIRAVNSGYHTSHRSAYARGHSGRYINGQSIPTGNNEMGDNTAQILQRHMRILEATAGRGATPMEISRLPTFKFNASLRSTKASTECPVCRCGFEDGENLRALPCIHTYHVSCIDPWLVQNRACPVCQARIC